MKWPALANGRAVLIGVERYGLGRDSNLTGPAADAWRMAERLLDGGVPAERIDLLLTPLDAARDARPRRGIEPRLVTGDGIYNYLNTELRGLSGEALLLYWSGHGVEHANQQWLLYPEATPGNWQGLDVTGALLPALTRRAYDFAEQFVFVDACRTPLDRYDLAHGPIGRALADAGARGTQRQHAILASPSGEATLNLPAERTGAFSRALGEAIDAEPGWPWRVDAMLDRIAAATGLPPVRIVAIQPDGSTRRNSGGAAPESGRTNVGRLLDAVPGMTHPDRVRKLAQQLERMSPVRIRGPESAYDIAQVLADSTSGFAPLLRLVRDRDDWFPDCPQTRALERALADHHG